jgi:hypothetical protein
MRLTTCEINRSLYLRTAFLTPTRTHLPIEFTNNETINIPIHMPKQPVIIAQTSKGHEIITNTLRCVKLAQSEYEAHLFLAKYSENYRVVNTTSKVGSKILERARYEGIIPAVSLVTNR